MDDSDVAKRKVIRSTYLDYYNQQLHQKNYLASSSNGTTTHPRSFPPTHSSTNVTSNNNDDDDDDGNDGSVTTTTTPPVPTPTNTFGRRICSLQEWTCRRRHHEELSDDDDDDEDEFCQIIYVFFVGGNPNAPPELLDESFTDFRQMLAGAVPRGNDDNNDDNTSNSNRNNSNTISYLPTSSMTSSSSTITHTRHLNNNDQPVGDNNSHRIIATNEPGVVYLNIRENQFDGKMTTWFQFAALVGEEYPEIDYAAKVDSDLLLFTPTFLKYVDDEHHRAMTTAEQQQQRRRRRTTTDDAVVTTAGRSSTTSSTRRVYGGLEFPPTKCVANDTRHDHPCPLPLVGRSYMSGELNFMSMDLARYIVSDACPRHQLTIPHEDVSLSNYVYSYINNTGYHEHERTLMDGRNDVLTTADQTEDSTISIISLDPSMILRTKDKAADGHSVNFRSFPERMEGYIFGHSSNPGPHPHFLWKLGEEYERMWTLFMFYHRLSLNGPSSYMYLDTLNNRTRKIRYPGTWPGLNLDRMANAVLNANMGNQTQLPPEMIRRIEWVRNQTAQAL